jgi:hypothetical protein
MQPMERCFWITRKQEQENNSDRETFLQRKEITNFVQHGYYQLGSMGGRYGADTTLAPICFLEKRKRVEELQPRFQRGKKIHIWVSGNADKRAASKHREGLSRFQFFNHSTRKKKEQD